MSSASEGLPLEGVVVLDLGQVYQGPYAGFLLAMAGARVIKVEPPRGETLRTRGASLPFAMLNSSKETIALDLKDPAGVAAFHRLAAAADVVLVNFAPGVPEQLGIGYGDLQAVNERLVYAHATGFGLDGGEGAVPAMDITVQAHAGVMSVNGFPDHGPVKAGVAFIDFLGGTHLYGAIVTALYERERTGRGRQVEVAMIDTAYVTLATPLGAWHQNGSVQRSGNRHPAMTVAPYDVYPCADGWVALIAVTDRHWRSVLEVIGRPDLLDDDRYRRHSGRAARMGEVDDLVGTWLAQRSRDEAVAALQSAHVPVAAVRSVDEVVRDEDLHARGALGWIDHPELGRVPLPAGPIRWREPDGTPGVTRAVEPSRPLGADTAAVLAELAGMTPEEIAAVGLRG